MFAPFTHSCRGWALDLQEMYVADVYVGTPAQVFSVVYDTGSANLWVPDVDCGKGIPVIPLHCPPSLGWKDD